MALVFNTPSQSRNSTGDVVGLAGPMHWRDVLRIRLMARRAASRRKDDQQQLEEDVDKERGEKNGETIRPNDNGRLATTRGRRQFAQSGQFMDCHNFVMMT